VAMAQAVEACRNTKNATLWIAVNHRHQKRHAEGLCTPQDDMGSGGP
jgi:hypothetical protein